MVLMLCDHLEARSRSLAQNGKLVNNGDISDLVERAFNQLSDDEQFDEVVIQLKMLREIKSHLTRELSTMYHKRIDYDADKKENEVI